MVRRRCWGVLRSQALGERRGDSGLPALPAALGVGHRPGVALHVQDVRRHLEPDREDGWGGRGRGEIAGDGGVEPRLIRWLSEYAR